MVINAIRLHKLRASNLEQPQQSDRKFYKSYLDMHLCICYSINENDEVRGSLCDFFCIFNLRCLSK